MVLPVLCSYHLVYEPPNMHSSIPIKHAHMRAKTLAPSRLPTLGQTAFAHRLHVDPQGICAVCPIVGRAYLERAALTLPE